MNIKDIVSSMNEQEESPIQSNFLPKQPTLDTYRGPQIQTALGDLEKDFAGKPIKFETIIMMYKSRVIETFLKKVSVTIDDKHIVIEKANNENIKIDRASIQNYIDISKDVDNEYLYIRFSIDPNNIVLLSNGRR